MRDDVERALQRAAQLRRQVLRSIPYDERVRLLESLFEDFFVQQRATLLKWAALTGQSAQVDTGYIAQHVASIVLGEPGQGFKGKGVDLADESEVKSAAILSGIDRPRWNHNLGTQDAETNRAARGLAPAWQAYMNAPCTFYLLFDRVVEGVASDEMILRLRAWCVDSRKDEAWRDLFTRFIENRKPSQYNLQLHPPVGYEDSTVVNTLGNLDMADVKVLEARMTGFHAGEKFAIAWIQQPPEQARPITGRCRALPYQGRGARPSRLMAAADLEPDLIEIASLLPSLDAEKIQEAASADALAEAETLEENRDQP